MAKYADVLQAQNDGLIHFWSMEESAGSLVADVIGGWGAQCYAENSLTPAEFDATVVSTPAGLGRDMSANWDGTYSDRGSIAVIRIDQAEQAPVLSEVAVRLRYFHRSSISDTYSVMSLGLFLLGRDSANIVYMEASSGSLFYGAGGNFGSLSDPFVDGQWYDIVITGDAASVEIYINGSLSATDAGSSTFEIYDPTDSTDSCFIGAGDSAGGAVYDNERVMDGIVQDFAIWNRKLTSQDVSDLYVAGTSEPLVADTSPITYDANIDATLEIEGQFSAQVNPAELLINAELPINFKASVFQDWVSRLPPAEIQEVYRLVITGDRDGLSDLAVGQISSWQATNQAQGRSVYLQAVIPAASDYLADIEARKNGDIAIQKGYRFSNGRTQYEEIIRTSFDSLRPDRGQRALTITVSGYMQGKPLSRGTRTLSEIRSISTSNGKRRVRCAIDLFLQPGMTVTALGDTFTADFINYYVTQADKFCEVSER